MHKIHLEENAKPSREPQKRLNPAMQEVVRAKVIKLLDAGIIYPIFDSKWVSLIHVVPKRARPLSILRGLAPRWRCTRYIWRRMPSHRGSHKEGSIQPCKKLLELK
jgi:hypothetical protein